MIWYDLQVPIGGCYRLIDVPMSNCINSGIKKIFILTQFNSFSLNRHLARTYNLGNGVNFGDGFVEVRWQAKRILQNYLILSQCISFDGLRLCCRHLEVRIFLRFA